jgi:hypothetical protein
MLNGTVALGILEPELITPTIKAATKKINEMCIGNGNISAGISGTKPDKFTEQIYKNKK